MRICDLFKDALSDGYNGTIFIDGVEIKSCGECPFNQADPTKGVFVPPHICMLSGKFILNPLVIRMDCPKTPILPKL